MELYFVFDRSIQKILDNPLKQKLHKTLVIGSQFIHSVFISTNIQARADWLQVMVHDWFSAGSCEPTHWAPASIHLRL